MPKSALPPHLQDFNWEGTDNASWIMRQKKKVQILLAAGSRVPSGFWKWRDMPITIFGVCGAPVTWRWENTDGTVVRPSARRLQVFENFNGRGYTSRIQPWVRFHLAIMWPFFFNFHVIYRQKDVVMYPTYQSSFGISKMFTFGFGFKRDGDKVYWLTANVGGNFE